jgi:K+-transporting ATPase ATPase A chain
VLASVVTSNGATGSFNAAHDSYRPLGTLVVLGNLLLGEVAFGGLGSGLYGIVIVALVGVFLGGLMVGRTPQYLGKTVTIAVAKRVALFAVLPPLVVLLLTAAAVLTGPGRAGITLNTGARGFTEILFTYASCMANNGLSLGGLDVNNPFYNLTTIVPMVVGRFGLAAIALNLAGLLAAQKRLAITSGSLPSDTLMFGVLVLATLVLVGALCFLPALALGPIVEQLAL